jgi:hypothetical protein
MSGSFWKSGQRIIASRIYLSVTRRSHVCDMERKKKIEDSSHEKHRNSVCHATWFFI